MPEGPSIVILREQVARFEGKKILRASGNSKIEKPRLAGRCPTFRSWGKHFLIEVPGYAVRVHFLLFGSYTIDSRKDREPRLRLNFRNGEINFYSCAIKPLDQPVAKTYDWRGDVMSDEWDAARARRKLRAMPDTLVCDALLDQNVFAGVGNIIKNEVLYRIRVHPLSTIGALPAGKLQALVREARKYSFDFLEWKKQFVLRKHWLAHNKSTCASCGAKLTRAYLGITDRRTFYCDHCQVLYAGSAARPTAKKKKEGARQSRSAQDGSNETRAMIVVATAGWSIPRLVAASFPGEGTQLERYARAFRGVEINSSAYREHSADSYANWARRTPRTFRFAVKLPQSITHDAQLRGTRRALDAFLASLSGLGGRLGPLVVQLPPSFAFEPRVANRFFALLRERHAGDVACEPRHPGWFDAPADRLLVRHRIARIAADPAVVPAAAVPGGWPGLVYYRLHGSPRKYWSIYEPERVAQWTRELAALPGRVRAWCVFDNTAASGAAGNALQMLEGLR